mgnify:CR=1 FL=1
MVPISALHAERQKRQELSALAAKAQDVARHSHPPHQPVHVGLGGQQPKVDIGRAVGAAARHASPAFGAQHAGVQADAVAIFHHPPPMAFAAWNDVELKIRTRLCRGRAHKAPCLDHVRRQHPAIAGDPAQAFYRQTRQRPQRNPVRRHRMAFADHHHVDMVLQVLPHPRQIMPHSSAKVRNLRCRTNARAQQKIGRSDGTGGKDHLGPRQYASHLPLVSQRDPGGAPVGQVDLVHLCLGQDGQVGPRSDRRQKGARG